jgi:MoaA/NifB/PqqE/SkfB family radical SAM enzyme
MDKLEHIDYEISKACNLSCIHCSALAGKGEKPDLDLIKRVLNEAKPIGLKRLGITGGEPFLFPETLAELIDYSFDKLECPVHIHSNGVLISDNLSLIKKRPEKIENITLTLLGNEIMHNLNCKSGGAYQKARDAAEKVIDSKTPLTVFLIPMSNNFAQLPEAARDFYEIGVRKFRIMRLSPGGRAEQNYNQLKLNDNQTHLFMSGIESLKKDLDAEFDAGYCTRLLYPELKHLKYHDLCMSGKNRVHINAEGYVFPCTASSGFIEMNAGNIKTQSLEEIWLNSAKLKEIRKTSDISCKVQSHYENKKHHNNS